MNLRDKWGNLYPGFMLMSGGKIYLTKEKADEAMLIVDKRYKEHHELQLQIDLKLFKNDLRKKGVDMMPTPHKISIKRPASMSIGDKLLSIWNGSIGGIKQ